MTCDDRYEMPTDTAKSKLLVSVHFYDPSGYTLNSGLENWGTKRDYETQNDFLKKMTKFTEQGYGVIIGEYGVQVQNGVIKDDIEIYTENILNNSDVYGYCPVLWDCSGMFDRTNLKIIKDEMATLFIEHSYKVQSTMTEADIIAAARTKMDEAYAAARPSAGVDENTAMAWLMYADSSWGACYSIGDTYSPDDKSGGIVATDVEVTGEGTYTVALDFTGTGNGYANSVAFSALGIANGETLYPGYVATVKEIKVNGQSYAMQGDSYTCSDDGKCTRVNIYNAWVGTPTSGRTESGDLTGVTPTLLDATTLGNVETISITFYYGPVSTGN